MRGFKVWLQLLRLPGRLIGFYFARANSRSRRFRAKLSTEGLCADVSSGSDPWHCTWTAYPGLYFFGYQSNEALHLSERERKIVLDCFSKIEYELEHAIDKHSKRLIVSNIEMLLNYCVRFYDRQFITRDNVHKGILERFENLLNEYFQSDKPQTIGLPSVAYCASELNLSANYFGDLVKKETGKTAQEYIQSKVIDVAKEKIFDQSKSVSQIAYELGFKYPQHFTRLFKQRVGQSPNEYRSLN